jgi:hypothetical protein
MNERQHLACRNERGGNSFVLQQSNNRELQELAMHWQKGDTVVIGSHE